MLVRVPHQFAESIRAKRLIALSMLVILCVAGAMFADSSLAYAAIPFVAYMLIILSTYKLPLHYRITRRGIYLTSPVALLALPLTLATNFWTAWPLGDVTEVQHSHHQEMPAILIRTRLAASGTLIPVEQSDADKVASYLREIQPTEA